MTLFARITLLLSCFFYSLFASAQEPDLYSQESTKKFAKYLIAAQDYNLAAQELERLHFMQPNNDSLQWLLLRAYRLGGQSQKGIQRFRDFYFGFPPEAPINITQEYYAMLLRVNNFGLAQQLVNRYPKFNANFKQKQQAGILLQLGQYDSTEAFIAQYGITDPILLSLSKRSQSLPRKSPFLSGALSTLVPGLGKIYTGNWQDGLIALVFVGGNAFGAYRGFRAQGVNSFYGWFFTATGSAFYASNIYGSVKAARVYNNKYKDALTQDVERYLYRAVD